MNGFFACLLLFALVSLNFAEVNRFVYEEPPNQGRQTIQGVEFGNQFLSSFEYHVEVEEIFRQAEVELSWYNQLGQILNTAQITHIPFNSTTVPQPLITRSPTLPMLEGRTQLLAFARCSAGPLVVVSFSASETIPVTLNSVQAACPGTATPVTTDCRLTFTPPLPGVSFQVITATDGSFTAVSQSLLAGTLVTSTLATNPVIIQGSLSVAGSWFLGPHIFQDGADAGKFIFIDSDQGPPDSPFIDFFECQGTDSCLGSPLVVETPRSSLNTQNQRFRYRVVFNKLDVFNATDPNGNGVPLSLRVSGFVLNNPALWSDASGATGLPGAFPKPESNAFADAFLLPVRFTNSVSPETGVKTTGTGPYPISISGVNPTVPQTVYPDDIPNFSYNSPIYPSETPFPFKYPFGPSLAPGRFQTFNYDFSQMLDGDYELWIGAEDVSSTFTRNGQSPGEINASGNRVPGVTTVIQIIRDSVAPNSFSVQLSPSRPFLILGDQSDPPLPYRTAQGEIFQISGTVSDERGEPLTMEIDLTRDDGTLLISTGKNGHFEEVRTFNGRYSQFLDFTAQDPPTLLSPVPPHPATGGQRAYQLTVFPVDPQGNISETTQALYIIKDLQPPQDPVITSPPASEILTFNLLRVLVEAPNTDLPAAPFQDLREHGFVNLELSIIDASGRAVVFTTVGQTRFPALTSSSRLDDDPAWDKPPGPFGGIGVSGVDEFGNLPDRFEFSQLVNLEEFQDGIITIIASLNDEAGNPSLNTSSILILKDTSGPVVSFNAANRQNSGPDNNYPVPNFSGADDDLYLLSMISPEFTVDFGLGGALPVTPDPGSQDLLHIEGLVQDNLNLVDRVQVSSSHIPSTTVILASPGNSSSDFEVDLALGGLLEGVRETLSFQGFDSLGSPGPIRSVNVYRDVSAPDAPQILVPQKLPSDSLPRVYTATDRFLLSGILSARDSRVVSLEDGSILRSRLVLLTPPEDPSAFSTGDQIPRIPATKPGFVPRLDSIFSSFPSSDNEAHFDLIDARDDGSFGFEVFVGNIPQGFTAPTTIYVQVIDQFDNTDPDQSIHPVEVFYLPNGAPPESLSLIDFRGTGTQIQVFPPISLPPSLLSTLFIGIEGLTLRLHTHIPMVEAPTLSLRQFGAESQVATLLSSEDPLRGSTVFDYRYGVLSQFGRFDGPVSAFVEGGQDLFSNSIIPFLISTVVQIDSLPPNIVTTAPRFEMTESLPFFLPSQGSRMRSQGLSVSALMNDFLESNGSLERSGVDTGASKLLIFGPLSQNPDRLVSSEDLGSGNGFDLSLRIQEPLVDGVYRMALDALDAVGNQHRFYSSFVFDQTPVAEPLLITTPQDKSVVSALPVSTTSQFIELRLERVDADLLRSSFKLFSPDGLEIALQPALLILPRQIRRFLQNPVDLTGLSDGNYRIEMEVFDLAGNSIIQVHSFLLDSREPKLEGFFPGSGTCIGKENSVFEAIVRDAPGREDLKLTVSGISRESSLKLILAEPIGKSSLREPGSLVQGELRILSESGNGALSTRKIMFLPSSGGEISSLGGDGSDDGRYRLEAVVLDSVGNQKLGSSTFFYDSVPPVIQLDDFSDGEIIAVTSGFSFDLRGVLSDEGPCHFFTDGAAFSQETTLVLEIFRFDKEMESRGAGFFSTTIISGLERITPPVVSTLSAQAGFEFTTFVSFQGTLKNQFFELELRAKDQAGNQASLQRIFQLLDNDLATPKILEPPAFSIIDSVETTYRTALPILTIGWMSVKGVEEVEVEVFRESLGSAQPIHRVTYLAHLSSSEPLSLTGTLPLTGVETFSIRIRGLDSRRQVSSWGPLQTLILDRSPFEVDEVFLLSPGSRFPLSSSGAFLTSADFELEVVLNKRFSKSSQAFHTLKIQEWNESVSLSVSTPTSLTTDRLRLSGHLALRIREDFPRKPLKLHLAGYQDLVGNTLPPFDIDLPLELGPEVRVKVFSNPVSDFELISVVRFVSHRSRLEKVKIIREGGEIISPRFSLRKGSLSRGLPPVPLDEGFQLGGLGHSFSVPLDLKREDSGFYFLKISYEDSLGRELVKEHEISLGRFSLSKGFVLKHESSKSVLRSGGGGGAAMASVFFTGRPVPKNEIRGEYKIISDLGIFGSSIVESHHRVQLSLGSIPPDWSATHTVILEKRGDSLHFHARLKPEQSILPLLLGHPYLLAEDLKDPVLGWSGSSLLGTGWQRLPIKIQEAGSGVDPASLKISQGDRESIAEFREDGQVYAHISRGRVTSQQLQIKISDRSGRTAILKAPITVIEGNGLDWVRAAPNPVRGSDSFSIHAFVKGGTGSMWIGIYDSSSALIHSDQQEVDLGRNTWEWDLVSDSGAQLANGVYFFKLKLKQQDRTYIRHGKFVLLR
jgi:hypothetical protein